MSATCITCQLPNAVLSFRCYTGCTAQCVNCFVQQMDKEFFPVCNAFKPKVRFCPICQDRVHEPSRNEQILGFHLKPKQMSIEHFGMQLLADAPQVAKEHILVEMRKMELLIAMTSMLIATKEYSTNVTAEAPVEFPTIEVITFFGGIEQLVLICNQFMETALNENWFQESSENVQTLRIGLQLHLDWTVEHFEEMIFNFNCQKLQIMQEHIHEMIF